MGSKRGENNHTPEEREQQAKQEELIEKLPDETDPAAERGERLSTGKAAATGGHRGGGEKKPRRDS